jgi:RNA polymerase sigma factor (sigma-70 family)
MSTLAYERMSDAQILSLHRGGDVDAFGELYRRHAPHVERFAKGLLRGYGVHLAEDITQAAFADVLVATRRMEVRNFRAFVLRATRWATYAALHAAGATKPKAHQAFKPQPVADCGLSLVDTKDPYDALLARIEIKNALGYLSKKQCQVYLRREIRGETSSEIADDLGLNHHTVENHLINAKTRMGVLIHA